MLDTAAKAIGISRRIVSQEEQGDRAIPRIVALAARGLDRNEGRLSRVTIPTTRFPPG
jgi:hypothetical protein